MDWPVLAELKQVLDVTSTDWDGDSDDSRLTRLLAAAIDHVKEDVAGSVDSFDEEFAEPTAKLAQAAMRMAERERRVSGSFTQSTICRIL